MGQEPTIKLPEGLLELKTALEAEWPAMRAALHASGVPLNEGDDDEEKPNDDNDPAKDKGGEKPPWGSADEFDPEKAWTLIQNVRKDAERSRREASEAKARAKEYEDQNKTEAQKLEERATEAEKRASAAETDHLRLTVALDKAPEGMPIAQVRKLAKRLSGTTKEEFEADADELFADFAVNDDDEQDSTTRRPRERLRPGAAPGGEPEETDPAKLADLVSAKSI